LTLFLQRRAIRTHEIIPLAVVRQEKAMCKASLGRNASSHPALYWRAIGERMISDPLSSILAEGDNDNDTLGPQRASQQTTAFAKMRRLQAT
jgi:hypothetical protein